MSDEGERERAKQEALDSLISAQAQLEAMQERMRKFRDDFRDERDDAIRCYLELGGNKKLVPSIIKASPQWLNRLLRGEAYRRNSD